MIALAPDPNMVKQSDQGVYDQHMAKKLAALEASDIVKRLPKGDVVLLCWEKRGVACHRRLVAEWLETELGITVPEWGCERSAVPAYQELPWAG